MKFTGLVVDDDPSLRQALSEVLLSKAHIVLAENGRVALDKVLGGLHPDFILLDMMMPVMNGFEFIKALNREMERDPSIFKGEIYVCSAVAGEHLTRFHKVRWVLTKPVEYHTLLEVIADVELRKAELN